MAYKYNTIYTNNFENIIDQLAYISSAQDMNMIYVEILGITGLFDYIFIFSSVICIILSLSSLTVLTILTIEDNLSNSEVLKITGYIDNEISSIILNIYTPIIIFAFFVSVYFTEIIFIDMLGTIDEF